MISFWKYAFPSAVLFCLAGCAVQKYHAVSIDANVTAARFESRNLADPGLKAFEEENLGHVISPWPPESWDLQTLSLAALYFNPALESARARIVSTKAALVTAGARPNPTLSIAPGIPSPYLLTLDFAIPIETAGKRTHRLQVAHSIDQAARFDLADSAWTIHSAVRTALLNYMLAIRTEELFRSEEKVRDDQVRILEEILSAGEIARQTVDLARSERNKTHLALVIAEGQATETKAALAAAVGIPLSAVQSLEFTWPGLETLPRAESLSFEEIKRQAVLNRLDLRRSLSQYAAAEAALQLEIAKQYPDINIGPGYTYEERHSFFTLGLSTTLPLFNRNEGPIAEAEAHRVEASTSFLERQAQAITRSERALAAYRSALNEQAEVQSLSKLQDSQLQLLQEAIRAGTDNRLNLDSVEIQSWVLTRAQLDALSRARKTFGELEDAIQRPLEPGEKFIITSESPALRAPANNRDSDDF
ncbi:MAG TPA: TolC family protein [Candidatus Acidoferrum sp.]|jgi:outer membrane protein TolC|nr:TolC family protein [Candidatus Acidoferrum sp.]